MQREIAAPAVFRHLGFISLGLIIVFSGLILAKTLSYDRFSQMAVYILFFASVPVITAASVYYGLQVRRTATLAGDPMLEWLGRYLPVAIILYGLWGIDRTLYHIEYERIIDATGFGSSPARFFYGCAGAALLIAWMAAARAGGRARNPAILDKGEASYLRFMFLGIFILGLFKIDLGHDTLSYDPYSGPASAVALGAVPMVEVFSQYGLNYLLLTAMLKLLPWSIYSMSLGVTILDLLYYLVVALICIRMARNKGVATILSAFLILFLVSAALYNPAYTPSSGAMRYLPSMLLLLALCHTPGKSVFSIPAMLSLALSSLWSLEAMIFSTITYGTYLLTMSISPQRIDIRTLVVHLLCLGAVILVPHVLLTGGYLAMLGIWPRYDIYLQLVLFANSPRWIALADPEIRTWVIFGFTYALGLSYALVSAWLGGASATENRDRYAVIAATSALGIMQFSYYAGRAVTPVLVFLAFPLLILFVLFVDDCAHSFRVERAHWERHQWIKAVLALFALVACGGVIGDRFFREPFVVRSNATLLRNCLWFQADHPNCVRGLTKRIREKLSQPAGFILPNHAGITERDPHSWQLIRTGIHHENMGSYLLAKKWVADQDRMFLFIEDAATVLFVLKKRNALGLTHSMVDDRSSILRGRAMQAAGRISEGTIIMVGTMWQQPIEQEVFAYLQKRWLLEQVDEMYAVKVFRIRSKGQG